MMYFTECRLFFQIIKYSVEEQQQEAERIHPGLTCFREGVRSIPVESIPGIRETGWKPAIRATRVNKGIEECSDPDTLAKHLRIVLNSVRTLYLVRLTDSLSRLTLD